MSHHVFPNKAPKKEKRAMSLSSLFCSIKLLSVPNCISVDLLNSSQAPGSGAACCGARGAKRRGHGRDRLRFRIGTPGRLRPSSFRSVPCELPAATRRRCLSSSSARAQEVHRETSSPRRPLRRGRRSPTRSFHFPKNEVRQASIWTSTKREKRVPPRGPSLRSARCAASGAAVWHRTLELKRS